MFVSLSLLYLPISWAREWKKRAKAGVARLAGSVVEPPTAAVRLRDGMWNIAAIRQATPHTQVWSDLPPYGKRLRSILPGLIVQQKNRYCEPLAIPMTFE